MENGVMWEKPYADLKARLPAPLLAAGMLTFFSLLGTALVAGSFLSTQAQVARNEREFLLRSMDSLIPRAVYDNDLLADKRTFIAPDWLGTAEPVTFYRARKQGEPVAVIFNPVAPDGYSGKIELLVSINYGGDVRGVRVISHRETPGLGDAIETHRSSWIFEFNQKALQNTIPTSWTVKKEGGQFDQFTGATITPRAVVKAVYKALQFYQQHRADIFAAIN